MNKENKLEKEISTSLARTELCSGKKADGSFRMNHDWRGGNVCHACKKTREDVKV